MLRRKKIFAVLISVLIGSSMASAIPTAVAEENTSIIESHFSDGSRDGWAIRNALITVDETEGAASPGCIKIGGALSIQSDKGGFEDDAVYRFSGKFKGSGEMVIRTEFYESITGGFSGPLGAIGSDPFTLSEEWQAFSYTFKPLAGATAAAVFIQGKNAGIKYVDDILLVREAYTIAEFEPEHVFYYTEFGSGKLFLTPNTARFPDLIGGKVVFSVSGTDFSEEKPISGAGKIESTFPLLTVLEEIGKEYTAKAQVYNITGELVATYTELIHRYPRPTYIRSDGVFEKNGHALDPVLMTGLGASGDYKGAASLGASVASAYATVSNERLNYIGDILGDGTGETDADGAPDMYAAVALYTNMKPAGHPDNLENTKARVADLKQNPYLFGYAIMDEPFAHYSPETARELLRISYKTIRDIDPAHPIYLVEITSGMYEEAARYCDIFFPDIYPASTALGMKSDYLARLTKKAVEAAEKVNKPACILHQAYTWGGWTPTGAELRNMMYRAFLEGAKGFGYYCYDNAVGTSSLKDTDMGAMLKEFSGGEQKLLFDLFLRGERKGEGETAGAVWQAISANGKNYLVIANRSMESSNTVSVVLTQGASLTEKFGTATAENFDGFLRITLSPSDVTVYEVTVPEGAAFIGESPTLANGDMEAVSPYGAYPDGWERVAANSPAVSTLFSMSDATEAHSGTACAKIGGIVGDPYVYYRTAYTHGENYEVSFYFKYKEASGVGVPRIEVRNGIWGNVILDGKTNATYWNTIPGTAAETWVKCTYHFTAPSEGTEPLAICLYGKGNTVCCYDDVVLKPSTTGIQYLNAFGETFTAKETNPSSIIGCYFPEDTKKTRVLLSGAVYQTENGVKELCALGMEEAETEGNAVTLRTWLDVPTKEKVLVEGFLWKEQTTPIL